MPSMKVVKNVTERMKNLSNFLVSVGVFFYIFSLEVSFFTVALAVDTLGI